MSNDLQTREIMLSRLAHEAREKAFDRWWKLSTHNGTLPEHRQSLAREAYYAAWGGGVLTAAKRDRGPT